MTPDERDPVVDRLFEGLETPAPPQHLRARVLSAARAEKSDTVDLWTRIWINRPLRLAWAAALVVLLAAHVVVDSGMGTSVGSVDPGLVAENRVGDDFVDLLPPARISDNVQPIVGLFAVSGDLTDLDLEGNPS